MTTDASTQPDDERPDGLPAGDEGIAIGAGEPSTFEPEEDPASVPEDPAP